MKIKQMVLTDGKEVFWNTALDKEPLTVGAMKTRPEFKGDLYWTEKTRDFK